MSAPDPEKWAMTDADWAELMDKHGFHHGSKFASEVVATVARRRAVEELEALFLSICPGCANGKACYHSNSRTECPTQKIHARIAAIEAEEA